VAKVVNNPSALNGQAITVNTAAVTNNRALLANKQVNTPYYIRAYKKIEFYFKLKCSKIKNPLPRFRVLAYANYYILPENTNVDLSNFDVYYVGFNVLNRPGFKNSPDTDNLQRWKDTGAETGMFTLGIMRPLNKKPPLVSGTPAIASRAACYFAGPERFFTSSASSIRYSPGSKPQMVAARICQRTNRRVGKPTAAVMRLTCLFLPSVRERLIQLTGICCRNLMDGLRGGKSGSSVISLAFAGKVLCCLPSMFITTPLFSLSRASGVTAPSTCTQYTRSCALCG
jgi:hypothetical protein